MRGVHQHSDAVVYATCLRGAELRGVERVQLQQSLRGVGDADEDGDDPKPRLREWLVRVIHQHRDAGLFAQHDGDELRHHDLWLVGLLSAPVLLPMRLWLPEPRRHQLHLQCWLLPAELLHSGAELLDRLMRVVPDLRLRRCLPLARRSLPITRGKGKAVQQPGCTCLPGPSSHKGRGRRPGPVSNRC